MWCHPSLWCEFRPGLYSPAPPILPLQQWYQTRARARLSEFIILRQLSSCGVERDDPSHPPRVTDRLLTIKPASEGRQALMQDGPQASFLMPEPNPYPNLINCQKCQRKFNLLH